MEEMLFGTGERASGGDATPDGSREPAGHAVLRRLEERLKRPVSLVLTDNGTSMLSARVRDGVLCLRLHRMFVDAGADVLEEIASYLLDRRTAMPCFRAYLRENRDMLRKRPPNKVPLRTAGKVHDLREYFDEINARYFGGTIDAAITWAAQAPRGAVKRRTLGSYSERSRTIRINPVLDAKPVPRYFLAFIVYHEMLHAALGVSRKGGRRSVHSREFRIREKLFHEYERAMAWERVR